MKPLDTQLAYVTARYCLVGMRRFLPCAPGEQVDIGLLRAGSGVVRIDPLHFLAGCRTRRLNQVQSVLYLSMFFYCVVVY